MATSKKPVAKKTVAKKTVAKKAPAKKALPADRGLPKPKKTPAMPKVAKPKAEPKLKVNAKTKTPKEIATANKEPWVSVIQVELDPDNIGNGAFELDWNDYFITKLVRAGYQREPNELDTVIVDRWFQDICRNVIMENFEQWEANQPKEDRLTLNRKDLGNGRTEIS